MMVMHIDDIKALAHRAHGDARERERLFTTMLSGDGREAYFAAWALTHLPVADNVHIAAHRDELVRLAISTSEVSLRRLSLVLLERLEWCKDDVRTDLLDFCLQRMMQNDEPYGIRALCVKLAYMQCRHYSELLDELKQSLLMMEHTEMGPGVKHIRNKILSKL